MAEQWLSIIEYARRFQISDMTIRRRIKTGKLQAVLQDGKYFIPLQNQDGVEKPGEFVPAGLSKEPSLQRDQSLVEHNKSLNSGSMTLVKGHPQHGQYGAHYSQSQHVLSEKPLPMTAGHTPIPVNNMPPVRHSSSTNLPQGATASVIKPSQNHEYGNLPENLWKPLVSSPILAVDTRALLAYCEATVKKASELERKAIDRFKTKIESLEASISAKDLEIKALRQQIEDMQLLVKIIERKK